MLRAAVSLPSSLRLRLDRLTADQRAAATAEPGPILCVAPAGSGKTTTLVARVCWLIGAGVAPPERVTAVTFNRRAAVELDERLTAALAEIAAPAPRVRVRTFHALAREILQAAGLPVEPLVERMAVLAAVRPRASRAELGRLDTAISRLKLDLGVSAEQVEADPDAGPTARAYVAYEAAVTATGGLDFDDLIVRALALLERSPDVLGAWRERCAHLLVDEAQDLDRSQLRLALLLASPTDRIFLVGDDDQSIYGWRLADVRRLLGLAETSLPGLRRFDLVTNFRCPAPVVERSIRLIEHNDERFAKTIRARDDAAGSLALARSSADDIDRIAAVLRSWPDDASTRAVLARTNRELVPAAMAAVRVGLPFASRDLELPVESPAIDEALDEALARDAGPSGPLLARVAAAAPDPETRSNLLAWSVGLPDLDAVRRAVGEVRVAVGRLRHDDAKLTLATVHGTKGLEFDHVAVVGLEAGRFPSARSVAESDEPDRALEEERRLAYVAWTRARRSLTLVFDPGAPSPFLREAFDDDELGLVAVA